MAESLERRQLLSATLTNLVNFDGNPLQLPVEGLVLADNTLYGVTSDFQIFSVPVSGGKPKLLATVSQTNRNLLLSGGKLYGTTMNNTIYSVPVGGGAVTTLATFSGFDGDLPNGNLIRVGNMLYGTTEFGGPEYRPTENFPTGLGTVFSVPIGGGPITDVATCDPTDGINPMGGLLYQNGLLYGTASSGFDDGTATSNGGTVFSVPITGGDGSNHLLAAFNGANGQDPRGELLFNNGTLYGLASQGGSHGAGTIFSVPVGGGTLKSLQSLDGVSAGDPTGKLIISGSRLYFADFSTADVCSVPVAGGSLKVEYQFDGNGDGRPDSYIVADSSGNLYGTTNEGGPNHMMGNGDIFKLSGSTFGRLSISGTVFDDQNQSGLQDATEPGVNGVTVYLDTNNNGSHDSTEPSTVTDSNGAYAFTGLAAGTYHVRELIPSGYHHVAGPPDHYDITLASGATSTGNNFALTSSSKVESLVVTSVTDEDNGTSDPSFGTGTSLREAINYANKQRVPDTISFNLGSGAKAINLGSALPALAANVTIKGTGASLLTIRRNTGGSYRIFTISSSATVFISGLTLSNGTGGIANNGKLTLANTAISGNSTPEDGGAINNGGTLNVTGSTFSNNFASGGEGGIFAQGTSVTITNSTFTGNNGGLFVFGATATVTNCTFSGNRSYGVMVQVGTATLNNNIIAYTTFGADLMIGGDPFFPTLSGSNNLISDGNIPPGLTGTITGNPKLGLLAFNGGTTQTFALLTGSPAINKGRNTLIPRDVTVDQRGLARTVDGTVDIGAFEYQQGTASITGIVYADTNGNGKLDTGEKGLAGVKVYLDTNNNGVLDTGETQVTTNSNGTYSFTALPSGTYHIREVVPTGRKRTAPTSGVFSVTLAPGQKFVGDNFFDTPS